MSQRKVYTGRVKWGWWYGRESGGWSCGIAVRVGRHLYRAGLGFDDDVPARPWPTWAVTSTRHVIPDFCIGLAGVFIGISQRSGSTPDLTPPDPAK